jgi:pSer/pThr/pTyr-binding forkhead associated (FHA) protein
MSAGIFLFLRIALTICLYAFLGWALFTLWQAVRQQGQILAARKVPAISLTIQTPGKPENFIRFTQPEITLGRDPTCEAPLADDSVSARHARLSYHHNQWWLEDLNSTNGTRINTEKLLSPTVVIAGDQIECGNTTILLHLAESGIPQTVQTLDNSSGG